MMLAQKNWLYCAPQDSRVALKKPPEFPPEGSKLEGKEHPSSPGYSEGQECRFFSDTLDFLEGM
jgi:hypothetical protein